MSCRGFSDLAHHIDNCRLPTLEDELSRYTYIGAVIFREDTIHADVIRAMRLLPAVADWLNNLNRSTCLMWLDGFANKSKQDRLMFLYLYYSHLTALWGGLVSSEP